MNVIKKIIVLDNFNNASKFQAPDLEDVRESVRQGVTKVAGKISSLANGVMSSLQVSYKFVSFQ